MTAVIAFSVVDIGSSNVGADVGFGSVFVLVVGKKEVNDSKVIKIH